MKTHVYNSKQFGTPLPANEYTISEIFLRRILIKVGVSNQITPAFSDENYMEINSEYNASRRMQKFSFFTEMINTCCHCQPQNFNIVISRCL